MELRIPTVDGYKLGATCYEPHKGNGKMLIISGANSVHHRFYLRYAAFMARRGYTVLTFDYRGIGKSKPDSLRGFHARLCEWGVLDLTGVIGWVSKFFPDQELIFVGHSVGGQLLGLTPLHECFSRILLIGAQSNYWRLWPAHLQPRMFLAWHLFIPVMSQAFGYFPAKWVNMGENLPSGVAREWARWGRHPEYMRGFSEIDYFDAVQRPIMALSFEDDEFAPRPAVEALLDYYSHAPIDHHHIHPEEVRAEQIGHFGFFRKQFRDTLWTDVLEWLTAPNPL